MEYGKQHARSRISHTWHEPCCAFSRTRLMCLPARLQKHSNTCNSDVNMRDIVLKHSSDKNIIRLLEHYYYKIILFLFFSLFLQFLNFVNFLNCLEIIKDYKKVDMFFDFNKLINFFRYI